MKEILVLFIEILTFIQLFGQQHVQETYPTVRFKCVDNQHDSVVIVREELPYHFNLYYNDKPAGLLSPSYYWDELERREDPKNNPEVKTAQAWSAWFCARFIPGEVKDKLDLSSRDEDHQISYLLVKYELSIMVRLDKSEKIFEVDFFFQDRDLYKSVTEDQLMTMYKGVIKNCRLIEGIYRLPDKGVEAKEFEPAETYVLQLDPNSDLRWAKECQLYNPRVWESVMEYFDSLEME